LWAKVLTAKDIRKEIFPFYGRKCLSYKAAHSWVEKFSEGRSKAADYARSVAEVAQTTVKGVLGYGFRRTGKAMGYVLSMSRNVLAPPPPGGKWSFVFFFLFF
jgi:hypothetical protein